MVRELLDGISAPRSGLCAAAFKGVKNGVGEDGRRRWAKGAVEQIVFHQ